MSATVRRTTSAQQAKGIREQSAAANDLSPRLSDEVSEIRDALETWLRVDKAETIGAALGVGRTRAYDLIKDPSDFPVGRLRDLARGCPDPVVLDRIAHCLLAASAAIAMERKRSGEIAMRWRSAKGAQPGLF